MTWFERLFCKHEWEIYQEYTSRLFETWEGKRLSNNPSKILKIIILRCKKCGDIKHKRINL